MRVKKESVTKILELSPDEIEKHTYKEGEDLMFIPIRKSKKFQQTEGQQYSNLFKPKLLAIMTDCKKLNFLDYWRKSGLNLAAYVLCSHGERASISYKKEDMQPNKPLKCTLRSSCHYCFPELKIEDSKSKIIKEITDEQPVINLIEVTSSIQSHTGIQSNNLTFTEAMQIIEDNIRKELHAFEAFCYQQSDPLQAIFANKPRLGLQVNSAVLNSFVTPLVSKKLVKEPVLTIVDEEQSVPMDEIRGDKNETEINFQDETSHETVEAIIYETNNTGIDEADKNKADLIKTHCDKTPNKNTPVNINEKTNMELTPNTVMNQAEEYANKAASEAGGGMVLRSIKPKKMQVRNLFNEPSPKALKNRIKQQVALKDK